MPDVSDSRRAAFEAARRAQEARMRAEAEMRRLQAEQARQAQAEGARAAQVTREQFVAHATVGANAAERGRLFDQLDTDGTAGLSVAELEAHFQRQGALPPAPHVSGGVQGDIDDALRDDDNTLDDLLDAAGHIETPADVDAILAAAEATGQDEAAVLRGIVRRLGDNQAAVLAAEHALGAGHVSTPTALYEAVAAHFDRLGRPGLAAATRQAGDPDVRAEVRVNLARAMQDRTGTRDDLARAAREARSPADLAAIMAVAGTSDAIAAPELLQEALLGLDEDAAVPNSALMGAIADQYEALGQPERAAAVRAAADPQLGAEVRRELIHALQDGDGTRGDLVDAFGAADSAREREAVRVVGAATIGEAATTEVAGAAPSPAGGSADDVAEATALAADFERRGDADAVAALRTAADPDTSPAVRRQIVHALRDGTGTRDDLQEGARAARTGAEVEALLAANRATGAMPPRALLQEVLLGLNEGAEVANTSVLNAVADGFAAAGMGDRAAAARAAADPNLSPEVRRELIHAIQDDDDTAQDIADALALADAVREARAAETTGNATIGETHTAQLVAMEELARANAAYEAALAGVASANETLSLAMAQMEGMPPEAIDDFVTEFRAQHPEYLAVDAARAEVARVVADNRDAIADALSRPEQLAEVDAAALEDALVLASEDPAGRAAAKVIVTRMLEHADQVPSERLAMVVDGVLPGLFQAELEAAMAENGGDPASALEALQQSDLFRAAESVAGQVKELNGVRKKVRDFVRGVEQLRTAIRNGDANAGAQIAEEATQRANTAATEADAGPAQASRVGGLDAALGGMGLFLGGIAFARSSDFTTRVQVVLGNVGNASSVIRFTAQSFGRLATQGGLESVLRQAGPVAGLVAGAISGFRNLDAGRFGDAAIDGANLALGILGMTTSIPGLGIASGALALGLFVANTIGSARDHDRRVDEIRRVMGDAGIEPGMVRFLTDQDPGNLPRVQDHLGLTFDQIAARVREGSPWQLELNDFATPEFEALLRPIVAPDRNMDAALDRLGAGLDVEGTRLVAQVLGRLPNTPAVDATFDPPVERSLEVRFQALMSELRNTELATMDRAEFERAEANLRASLGLPYVRSQKWPVRTAPTPRASL